MQKILSFITKNYKVLCYGAFAIFILYWIVFILTPQVKMGAESKKAIESLNQNIEKIEKNQNSLDRKIEDYSKDINEIESRITEIKSQKTIIKEIYNEKINSVNSYTDYQLDSFFTIRYGYFENSN